jgi:ubiquinone/menaquinone biosynthesis C-methylase UbiE
MNLLSIWKSDEYYDKARIASQDSFSHPGWLEIKKIAAKAESILEVGCGEGTKLANISSKNTKLNGVDLSQTAVKTAQKQFKNISFEVADASSLPFKDSSFDLVYSAFMIEHIQNPEKVIKEMLRVTKDKKYLALLAPNYGAPNRHSPCSKVNPIFKIILGFLEDLFSIFISKPTSLSWQTVVPIADEKHYEIDWDTTVEPYARSLIQYFQNQNLKIIKQSTCWNLNEENEKIFNKVFRFLGKRNLYPFRYWGPHLLIISQK